MVNTKPLRHMLEGFLNQTLFRKFIVQPGEDVAEDEAHDEVQNTHPDGAAKAQGESWVHWTDEHEQRLAIAAVHGHEHQQKPPDAAEDSCGQA